MARTLDPVRSKKVYDMVSRGMSIRKSIKAAGYSESNSANCGSESKALTAVIHKAREKFSYGIGKGLGIGGLTGIAAGKKLAHVALHGKDFDAVTAIRVAGSLMNINHNNLSNVSIGNVFVVPSYSSDWSGDVKKFKDSAVDVTNATDLPLNATVLPIDEHAESVK